MNEEELKQLREQMEVRIVALLLGEASAFETADIEQAMQRDPELAAFHTEMRRTIELTREASKQFQTASAPAVAQPKLSAERREKLLAHFRQGKVVEVPIKRVVPFRRRWLVPASLAAGIMVFLSALAFNLRRKPEHTTPLSGVGNEASVASEQFAYVQRFDANPAGRPTPSAPQSFTVAATPAPAANFSVTPAPSLRSGATVDSLQNGGLVATLKPAPALQTESAPKLYLPQSSSSDLGGVPLADVAEQEVSKRARKPYLPQDQTPSKPSAENEIVETLAEAVSPRTSTELGRAKSEGKVLEWGKPDNASELAHAEGLKRIENLREIAPAASKDPEWIGALDKEAKVPQGIDSAAKAGDTITVGALEKKRGEKPSFAGIVLPQEPAKGMVANTDSPTAGNGPATASGAKSGAYAAAVSSPLLGTKHEAELYFMDTDANKPKSGADRDGDGAHIAGTAESDSLGFGGIGGGGGLGGLGRGRPANAMATNAVWAFAGQPAKDANGSGTMDYSGFRFGGGFAGGRGASGGRSGKVVATNSTASTFTTGNNWAFAGQPAPGTTTAPVVGGVLLNGSLFGNEGLISLEGKNKNLSEAVDQSAMNRSDISGPADVDFSFGRSSTSSFQQRIGTRVATGQAATTGSHLESDGILMLGKAAESVPAALPTPALAPPGERSADLSSAVRFTFDSTHALTPQIDKIADPSGTLSGPALLAAKPVSGDPKKDVKAGDIDNYDAIGDIGGPMFASDAAAKNKLTVGAAEMTRIAEDPRAGTENRRFFRLRTRDAAVPSQKLAENLEGTAKSDVEKKLEVSASIYVPTKDEPALAPTPTQKPTSTALGLSDDEALRQQVEGAKASEDAVAKNGIASLAERNPFGLKPPPPPEAMAPSLPPSINVPTGGVYSVKIVGYHPIDMGISQSQRESQAEAKYAATDLDLNLKDADISHVIDVYGELTGRTVVHPNSLPETKINVHSQAPMKREEAVQLLDTVLAMNGITMLPQGDKAVKAVPQATAPTEAALFQDHKDLLEEKTRYITKAIQLKNAIPQDVTAGLQPFASTADSIKTINGSGTIILRDSEENIKRMEELIQKTDIAAVNEYEPLVIPIKNGRASEIAQAFNSLKVGGVSATTVGSNAPRAGLYGTLGGYGGAGGGGAAGAGSNSPTAARSSFEDRMRSIVNRAAAGAGGDIVVLGQAKIIADERSNSLLVFAKKGESETITNIIANLDVAQLGDKVEIDSKKKAAVVPLGKVVLTGITSTFGSTRALLEITEQGPGKPGVTRRPVLREGERDGSVEVLSIDAERSLVRIRNAGVETNISFEIPKPAASPLIPQPEINTRQNAFSTFSLNVSDVSFKLAAASLDNSVMPEPASIRVEEFVNAFNYHDPAPAAGARLAFAWERAHYPFAHNRDIVRFAIQTAARGREAQKPLNLVILLDNSGSMERADRVQIVREALKVLAQKLQPQDRISVVTFARTARLWVDGMAGGKPKEFLDKVLELNPDGGTNLEDALALGYATAAKHFLANGMNRVILLTDGAANLGNVEPEALKQKVVSNRIKGIALDCFGIGWEGYNDDLLEVLTHNGDGRYGFLDHPEEAAPEFANQLAGALNVEAADVKTQVEFNPRRVLTWRQIGYAKHQLTKEQFRDNKVDAAELTASESGNALYAIEVNPEGSGPIGTVRVRYRIPATGQYVEQSWPLPYQPRVPALDESSPAMRLAVTAAAFGEWLARSPYAGEVTPDGLQPYLNSVCETYAPDSRPQRLAGMIRQAQAIAGK